MQPHIKRLYRSAMRAGDSVDASRGDQTGHGGTGRGDSRSLRGPGSALISARFPLGARKQRLSSPCDTLRVIVTAQTGVSTRVDS